MQLPQTEVLKEIRQLGQQVWLDNLSRDLIEQGTLQGLIDRGLSGLTSNPSIFQKAIAGSPLYQDDVERVKSSSLSLEDRFEVIAIPDIQSACDLFTPLYESSGGRAGFVSLEVSPTLAHDEEGTVATGLRLKKLVMRENLLIKVPATPAGVQAIERLIAHGVSVNVTLMFSLEHMEAVAQAYLRGLGRLVAAGGDPSRVTSVASIFLSRVDSLVDKRLEALGTPEAMALRGKSALAMAKRCYVRYKELFHGDAFAALRARGGQPQQLLWASTGAKNPAYSPLIYVENLVGPETVNTMPDATLEILLAQGYTGGNSLEADLPQALANYDALGRLNIDLDAVGRELQDDGVRLFEEAFAALLAGLR